MSGGRRQWRLRTSASPGPAPLRLAATEHLGNAMRQDRQNVAALALLVAALGSDAGAAPQEVPHPGSTLAGTVIRQGKVSETEGGFTGELTPGTDPYVDPGDLFGIAVAAIDDLDGDGVADMAVGAYGDDEGGLLTGAIWIVFLNADQTVKAQQKISKTQGGFVGPIHTGDLFGWSLGFMGDLDEDGAPELAVGSWLDDDGFEDAGAVWILSLNPDGTVKHEQKISATQGGFAGPLMKSERFGTSLVNLGDLNGDGVNDLAAGAVYDGQGGHLVGAEWILFLERDGTVRSHTKITNDIGGFTGFIGPYSRFSYSAACLGDVDGDGVVDLAVGGITNIPTYDVYPPEEFTCHDNCGAVWILFLKPDGTVKTQTKIAQKEGGFTGEMSENENFAHGVTSPGDLDFDGVPDLLVGAVGDDGDVGGGHDTGNVWVLFLNPDGTVKGHKQITATHGGFTGDLDSGDFFGQSLCTMGDLNGDLINDVAIGAIGDDDGGMDQGAFWFVYLYGANWSQAGPPSTGSHGHPKLAAESSLQPDAPITLRVEQAAQLAPTVLLVSLAAAKQPLFGGMLVPDLSGWHLLIPQVTDHTGALALSATWPSGVPAATDVYFQCWIQDATAASGWVCSNSLEGTTP